MKIVKVQYAKTHRSALLHGVERGEEIVISRADQPAAKLGRIDASCERELGVRRVRAS
ncbi:type II toxin-antitoxin system Phd/YefM family antitoxin [Paramicrobacterium fandaimingii]|uniref:type II toxin-antitoxin system Phd/YefM family antitoxin n=1 Tax=Paramicrobacterium fandaimingii TaxID=2708079 RepID=UPI001AB0625D|nr:type II toxin-antitoxin system Phd/YefM family antitoxin [Microbacterium fandaimingii]